MELIPGLPNDMALECLVRIPSDHFSTAASVCKDWNFELQLPEFWRHRKAFGFARNLLVMAQARVSPAHNSLASKLSFMPVYGLVLCDPETGCWSDLPPPPGVSNGLPLFCQLVGVGNELVIMGGYNPETWEASKSVFVYSFLSAKWRRGADMLGGRRIFFGCASSDACRRVFVAGGHDGEKNALKSAMAYDVAKDKWTLLPDMAMERDECKGVFHRGKFHVIGGYSTNMQGRFEKSAEAFDIDTWQWDQVDEGFLEIAACPRTCTGGLGADEALYMCRERDIVQRKGAKWEVIGGLPAEVGNAAYLTTWHGKLLAIGSDKIGGPHRVYTMDLRNHTWSKLEGAQEYTGHVLSGCCLEI